VSERAVKSALVFCTFFGFSADIDIVFCLSDQQSAVYLHNLGLLNAHRVSRYLIMDIDTRPAYS
jgi:hypothetical protein